MRTSVLIVLAALALLLAAACGSGGSDGERTAAVIHRLLLAAGTNDTSSLESFPGELPDGLPVEPPIYPGADLVVSSRQPAPVGQGATPPAGAGQPQPLLYFIVLDTDGSRDDVFTFYEKELDEDPWQIESTFSTPELDTLQFVSVEDADIAGAVSIAHGGDDGRTTILISLQDSGALLDEEAPFELGESLQAPKEFPDDVPLYEGSTITSSAFFREPGNQSFLVIFLTQDAQEDVIEFYTEALESRGWAVTVREPLGTESRIEFVDEAGDIGGSIQADGFRRSEDYTEVRIQISLNPAREPLDGEGDATPEATPERTPGATDEASD